MEVHFIDVGQALSVLVECDGQFMLYDGGNVDDGSLIVSYLQSQGVEQLEYVFCSHAHEDHVGGLAAALAYFRRTMCTAGGRCLHQVLSGFCQVHPTAGPAGRGARRGHDVAAGRRYRDHAGASGTVQRHPTIPPLVLRIDYGSTSFLLTGDMEKTAETDLVNSGANLRADVLQVGHHGSSTSTSYLFPECGAAGNGHHLLRCEQQVRPPHEETLSILRDAGVDVYRTDLQGTITIGSDARTTPWAPSTLRQIPR